MKPLSAALASCLILGLWQAADAKDPPLPSLTMEHFRDTATITENPQATAATISTEKGFVRHTGPLRMVWSDEYLNAVIDEKTGQRSFQVQAYVIYSGAWRSYETATYRTPDGPKSVPAIKVGKEVANCAVGDCTYTERIAFAVDEPLLRRLAEGYTPGHPAVWTYAFSAKSGPDYAGEFSSAEIAGLLAKVDGYTNTRPEVKAAAASASLKHDLGIAGLAVAATADHPSRAGVLIIGIDDGSVAQKTGMIIGDILYELDGHPIKTLTELQAAVAACPANAAVPIKLYRGTGTLTVSARF